MKRILFIFLIKIQMCMLHSPLHRSYLKNMCNSISVLKDRAKIKVLLLDLNVQKQNHSY